VKIKKLTLKRYVYSSVHGAVYFIFFILGYRYCTDAFNRPVEIGLVLPILLLVSFCLLHKITNNLSRFMGYFWLWWMLVGIANSASWSILHSAQDLDIERASTIYLVFLVVFLLGVFLFDRRVSLVQGEVHDMPHKLWVYLLLAYPLLMFLEAFISLGYIPILSGVGIVEDMYNVNYGSLYSYKSVMLFSILLCLHFYRIHSEQASRKGFIYIILLLVFLFISLFDGKRVVFLASLLMMLGYMFKVFGLAYVKKNAFSFGFIACFFYVGTSIVRAGTSDSIQDFNLDTVFYSVGAEFRDFAWTVTNYEPGEIPNYSWTISSLGSFVNGAILKILGYEKATLVSMDSARSWMDIFGIELGIRTGLFSELWFEFGFYGLVLIFVLGVWVSKLSAGLYEAKKFKDVAFKLFIYAFIVLSIMGQSSLFFGVFITAVYVYAVLWIIQRVFPKNKDIIGVE